MLLGAIFVAIVILMPEGLVPGSARLWRLGEQQIARACQARGDRSKAMSALTVTGLSKAFGGLHVTRGVDLNVEPGERRLIIGPNGAGKTTLVQSDHRRAHARCRLDPIVRPRHHRACRAAAAPISAWRAPIRSSRCSRHDTIIHNVTLALLGLSPARWNPLIDLKRHGHLVDRGREALDRVGLGHIAERPLTQTSYGERRRVEIAMALAQNPEGSAARRAVRRPVDRRAPRRAADC